MLVNIDSLDEQLKVSAVILLNTTLINDTIQRVPHLMRNGRIYQCREVILRLEVIIEDLRRDIDKLEQILKVSFL